MSVIITADGNTWIQMPSPSQPFPGKPAWKFTSGDMVRKPRGSWWEGRVVGFYSTDQTPRGYAVQLQTPSGNGPVQIYPESALERVERGE